VRWCYGAIDEAVRGQYRHQKTEPRARATDTSVTTSVAITVSRWWESAN
jgi:hypothetical protein